MSAAAASLFARLQAARFYRNLHIEALTLVADRPLGSWLDVGCGPGLWTRLAAESGYCALGVDRDPDMIDAAYKEAAEQGSLASFEVNDLDGMVSAGNRFDIVSASSLVVVTQQPDQTLRQLFALLNPGGALLLLEASPTMTRRKALLKVLFGRIGPGAMMLQAWATARSGSALPDSIFRDPGWKTARLPLLGGMANAWLLSAEGE